MSDLFGLLALPAPAAAAGAAVTDPLLDVLLAYAKAVLNEDLGTAWAAIAPADPLPVAYVFNHNPDLESFNSNETPALYMWRGPDNGANRYAQDVIADDSGFHALWVPPPMGQEDRRVREAIRNGIKKSLRAAFANGRHPAWIVPGDTYYEPAEYGSVLLRHAKCGSIRLGQFRAHELVIESEDKSFRQPFDCLFFTVETTEFYTFDAAGKFGALDHLRGTVRLPPRELNAAHLDVVSQGETLTYQLEMELTAPVVPATGPAAGRTVVRITGTQFIDGMVVLFDTTEAELVQFIDETTVDATAPAHAVGVVAITVLQAAGGVSKTLAAAFTYV